MTAPSLLEETAEDLFENAPCGYVSTSIDGTFLRVNRTFEDWTGRHRDDLVGTRRFQELLAPGARIYYETHVAPLLQLQESVREIAVDVLRADGSRLPALINAVLRHDEDGNPAVIRTTIFDATDRRRYEQALLSARRHEQEIARHLQRSMLSGAIPAGDGLEIGVSYQPATDDLEIGGDWFDAFWIDEGEVVGLVVGDVVGKGIDAAAVMGQLRSALRALASTGMPPSGVLDGLDLYVRRHGVGEMTTIAYIQLSIRTGSLRYACAGHPPPLVLVPGAEPEFLWGGRSLPLDAHGEHHRRPEHECTLAPGGLVVLYTDGLVERRARSITDGMEVLAIEAAACAGGTAPAVAESLVRTLRDPSHQDDVCVLTARRCIPAQTA